MREETLWIGKSSQWINFKTYFFCTIGTSVCLGLFSSLGAFALIGVLLCLGKMVWAYFEVQASSYRITNQAIVYEYGLLTRKRAFIEMFRIHDTTFFQPLWYRIFGLGTIRVLSTQWTSGHIVLEAIPNPRQIQDLVRCLAEGRGNLEDYALLEYGPSVRMLN